jgi:hypothetical protein
MKDSSLENIRQTIKSASHYWKTTTRNHEGAWDSWWYLCYKRSNGETPKELKVFHMAFTYLEKAYDMSTKAGSLERIASKRCAWKICQEKYG